MSPPGLYPPSRPQSIGEVLDTGFRIFQSTFLACLPYGVLWVIVGQLANLHDLAAGRPLRAFGDPMWWLWSLFGAVAMLLIWSSLILRQSALASGAGASVTAEVRAVVARVPQLFALVCAGAVACAVGLVLFVVPGIYLIVAFAFAIPAMLTRDLGPLDALKYCARLVYGNWWRTTLILGIAIMVILALYAVIVAATLLAFGAGGIADVALVTAVSRAAGIALGAVIAPFTCAMILATLGELGARREMSRTLVLAASLLAACHAGGALAQAPSQVGALGQTLNVIDGCIVRLDAEVDVGFRRIALRCPDLPAALERGGLVRWLPQDWRDPDNNLSASGLEELRQLLASELTMHPLSRPPSVQRLRLARADLGAPARSGTVWGELERWLRRLGGRREPAKTADGLRILDRIDLAPVVPRMIVFAGLAVLLGLAAVILLNELRVARVLRAPSARRRGVTVRRSAASTAEVEQVSAVERPRVLLARVLERLSRARGLTGLGSLTSRELIRAAPFDDVEAARQLAQLAITAERMCYAATPATAGELAAAAHDGSALLEKLSAW